MNEDRAGGVLAGRFRLEDAVGRGGMATVHRAIDLASGHRCAVKLLHGTSAHDAVRFEREAELLAEITHPAVVRHLAHGRASSGEPWLAMEWLDGVAPGPCSGRPRTWRRSRRGAGATSTRAPTSSRSARCSSSAWRDTRPSPVTNPWPCSPRCSSRSRRWGLWRNRSMRA